MKTFVLKRGDNSVQVYVVGETVVLDNGTKIPYGNLDTYSPEELLSYGLYAFDPPIIPSGKRLVSVSYEATPGGVDQIPVFADLPAGPVIDRAKIAASNSYIASLRRKARHYALLGDTAKSVQLSLKAAGVPL